ncbi:MULTISPECIES: bacillithiol system redox-active protein YtxJ [Persicobacter]|uniref:Thioredoxin family protein n=1 Tax=Persicobacter diffluens TaxID=981 RepID=A0AAN4VUS2_9BACT|nr:bacillithiol system redox-active protein YtxJ [Persicobacter sp. CCB-QB2]GJM59689.1 thioredoxin family protein [Persicobacter diffluens]
MNWNILEQEQHLEEIREKSFQQPVVIFKHSTRCPISSMSLRFFESNFKEELGVKPYYLDLISFRAISNEIAAQFGVPHQSPQVILIKNGKAVFDTSHHNISFAAIEKAVKA